MLVVIKRLESLCCVSGGTRVPGVVLTHPVSEDGAFPSPCEQIKCTDKGRFMVVKASRDIAETGSTGTQERTLHSRSARTETPGILFKNTPETK